MPGFSKIAITFPDEMLARVNARAGVTPGEKSNGNRSLTITEDLRTFYDLAARAERTVRSVLSPEQIAACRAALLGTFIEPSLIPHLASEVEEALEGTDPLLVGRLQTFGVMELYALGRLLQGKTNDTG